MTMSNTTIQVVAARLRHQKATKQGSTVLFLGAGASISAGIPGAGMIMERMEADEFYSSLIGNAPERTYAAYMSCLVSNDRKRLIDGYVAEAKINPAHLYAAHLIAEGYIDCVVTTNFDPLILRALALYNTFPAVYDLTTMRDRVTNNFDFPAVLFLHGQNHGFWQMNTPDEMKDPVEAIRQAFVKISQTRSWLVVGYSGNDPVFEQLASIDKFGDGLYWAGSNQEPEQHVKERLIDTRNKGASFLPSQDADSLFRELNAQLKLGDPPFIRAPFTHMLGTLSSILPAKVDDQEVDLTKTSKQWLAQAVEIFERGKLDSLLPTRAEFNRELILDKLYSILANDDFDNVGGMEVIVQESKDPFALELLSRVFNAWGLGLFHKAEMNYDYALFAESFTKYAQAVKIKPNMYDAWNNWGVALFTLAKLTGNNALFADCLTKFTKALETKPDMYKAWYNMGLTLSHLGKRKADTELLTESFAKYARAAEIKPDLHEAWDSWGSAIIQAWHLAPENHRLQDAIEKTMRAESIKKGEGSFNLACAYSLLGHSDQAIKWLQSAHSQKGEKVLDLLDDPDLENIRATPEFQALLARKKSR
jgi:tetratricopeptide (TPR) repeat protein